MAWSGDFSDGKQRKCFYDIEPIQSQYRMVGPPTMDLRFYLGDARLTNWAPPCCFWNNKWTTDHYSELPEILLAGYKTPASIRHRNDWGRWSHPFFYELMFLLEDTQSSSGHSQFMKNGFFINYYPRWRTHNLPVSTLNLWKNGYITFH